MIWCVKTGQRTKEQPAHKERLWRVFWRAVLGRLLAKRAEVSDHDRAEVLSCYVLLRMCCIAALRLLHRELPNVLEQQEKAKQRIHWILSAWKTIHSFAQLWDEDYVNKFEEAFGVKERLLFVPFFLFAAPRQRARQKPSPFRPPFQPQIGLFSSNNRLTLMPQYLYSFTPLEENAEFHWTMDDDRLTPL